MVELTGKINPGRYAYLLQNKPLPIFSTFVCNVDVLTVFYNLCIFPYMLQLTSLYEVT